MSLKYHRIAFLKTAQQFLAHLYRRWAWKCPSTSRCKARRNRRWRSRSKRVRLQHPGNRFCILPMEGWDGTRTAGPQN
jgi:hypothetical protein